MRKLFFSTPLPHGIASVLTIYFWQQSTPYWEISSSEFTLIDLSDILEKLKSYDFSLFSSIFFFNFSFLFLAVLGLRFCARAFSSCGKRGPLLIAVRGPLTIAASLVAEHKLQMHRLSSCGSQAQLLHGMWDLPRPGLEPVFPALAGRFSTTAPPGKPPLLFFDYCIFSGNLSQVQCKYITVAWWLLLPAGFDAEQGPVGLLGTKPFCVPHFFDYRK